MHESLADTLRLVISRIVTGTVQRKQRIHAAVPVAHPQTKMPPDLVLDVKAPARRTDIRTGTAVNAGKSHFFPEGCLKKI